jgi:cytochrome b561
LLALFALQRLFSPTKALGYTPTTSLAAGYRPALGDIDVWRNTEDTYGLVAVGIHWLMALVIPGLFGLGLWMVELTYYDPWYKRAPDIHKGIGILLFLTLVFRALWRGLNPRPRPEPDLSAFERVASNIAHNALDLLLFATMLSGYLISTADGRPIDVFGLFQVPATVTGLPDQADVAGTIHLAFAITLVSLAGLHALAALKHHFFDRDRTLVRMLGGRR